MILWSLLHIFAYSSDNEICWKSNMNETGLYNQHRYQLVFVQLHHSVEIKCKIWYAFFFSLVLSENCSQYNLFFFFL